MVWLSRIGAALQCPFDLLCLLCRPGPQANDLDSTDCIGELRDWGAVVALAREHDVLPLAAYRLATRYAASLPSELADALALFNEEQRRRTGRLGRQMRELLAALAEAGIPAIAIKGPPLGRRIYGQAWLRGMRDLDILVRDEDVDRTLELLTGMGFDHERDLGPREQALLRHYAGQYLMTHPSRAPVEPHWRLAPLTLAFGLDHARLWRNAQPAIFRTVPHLGLTEGDTLLMLCLHGAKDRWRQLKLVADVAYFLEAHPELDWAAVQADAAADGCSRMLRLGVLLAHRLLHAAVPATVLQPMTEDRAVCRLADRAVAALVSDTTRAEGPYCLRRDYWSMHERRRDRWTYALRTISQPRPAHYRRLRLPARLQWAYPALKLPWDYVLTPVGALTRRMASMAKTASP